MDHGFVRDVADHQLCRAACIFDQVDRLLQGRLGASGDGHQASLRSQRQGCRASDARAAPGDERALTFEERCHFCAPLGEPSTSTPPASHFCLGAPGDRARTGFGGGVKPARDPQPLGRRGDRESSWCGIRDPAAGPVDDARGVARLHRPVHRIGAGLAAGAHRRAAAPGIQLMHAEPGKPWRLDELARPRRCRGYRSPSGSAPSPVRHH